VKPFQYCIGCGWELQRDNQWRPKEYKCENKYCREDIFYDIDKWAFRSKAWEVSVNDRGSEYRFAEADKRRNVTSSTSTLLRSIDKATESSSASCRRYERVCGRFVEFQIFVSED
jgi:hypothetical protein